jgi:hypothetical protein
MSELQRGAKTRVWKLLKTREMPEGVRCPEGDAFELRGVFI